MFGFPRLISHFITVLAFVVLSVVPAGADDGSAPPAPDKSGYTLFNPTPDDQLRSFSTDRPNKGNSPYTVDAGHFQYETDLFNYSYDHYSSGNITTENFIYPDPVLKLGLTNNIDFEMGFVPYLEQHITDRATDEKIDLHGFGDTTARVKVNLFGNDGGNWVMAAIPYVKIPTADPGLGNGRTEGGLILPIEYQISDTLNVVYEPEFDALQNVNGDQRGKHASISNLVAVNQTFLEKFTGSVELYSSVSEEAHGAAIYTLDTALTYLITPTLQIDTAIYFGLNRNAPDFNPYIGLSQRF